MTHSIKKNEKKRFNFQESHSICHFIARCGDQIIAEDRTCKDLIFQLKEKSVKLNSVRIEYRLLNEFDETDF